MQNDYKPLLHVYSELLLNDFAHIPWEDTHKDPWDWYNYLHEWLIFMVNVGKYTIHEFQRVCKNTYATHFCPFIGGLTVESSEGRSFPIKTGISFRLQVCKETCTYVLYIYTWNLFVLYFVASTLQKKALSKTGVISVLYITIYYMFFAAHVENCYFKIYL